MAVFREYWLCDTIQVFGIRVFLTASARFNNPLHKNSFYLVKKSNTWGPPEQIPLYVDMSD